MSSRVSSRSSRHLTCSCGTVKDAWRDPVHNLNHITATVRYHRCDDNDTNIVALPNIRHHELSDVYSIYARQQIETREFMHDYGEWIG